MLCLQDTMRSVTQKKMKGYFFIMAVKIVLIAVLHSAKLRFLSILIVRHYYYRLLVTAFYFVISKESKNLLIDLLNSFPSSVTTANL